LEEVKKMPKRPQVNVYIEVDDISAKLKEIKKAKGKVLMKKEKVGTMGWRGKFETPDGCVLCLWQPAPKDVPPKA
jgi:predicted enzyme related to lactoylglutathione lyase